MKAYKFRSSQQIEFIFDILINRRLYCADWKKLNDPMEGMFITHHSGLGSQPQSKKVMGIEGIISAKEQYKVCSLSKTFDNFLLWSHYADGYNGFAIEVELPEEDGNIKEVVPKPLYYFLELERFESEEDAAKAILLSKHNVWKYEKEIRILHYEEYYNLQDKPLKVIVGQRVRKSLTDALRIVCNELGVSIEKLVIGEKNLQTTPF